MKIGIGEYLLSIAVAIFIYSIIFDSCGDEVVTIPGDTTTHVVVLPAPPPDTVYIPHDSVIYRIIYKEHPSALLRERDSLLHLLAVGFDSAVFARLDSINNDICDSIMRYRTYTAQAGDSLVHITANAGLLGYLDTLKITWKHSIPDRVLPAPKFGIYTQWGIGFQKFNPTGLDVSILAGRKNLIGAGVGFNNSEPYWNLRYIYKVR